uniref:Uncharacterized protein n=1 Tax=Rhodopseudomonas palustris (strain DX-1) TaxID=652103 RepID=E6VQ20_RHOPX
MDAPDHRLLKFDDEFVAANKQWIESYRLEIDRLRKDLLQFRSDTKPHGLFSSTLRTGDTTSAAVGSLRDMIVLDPTPDLMNELLIRFCWQELDPQLQAASKRITVDIAKSISESIERHFSSFDEDLLQLDYRQQLRAAVHDRLMRLGSWFRQPEDGFVSATTQQLGDLIIVEAKDSYPTDNPVIEWEGDAFNVAMDGLSVHRMYDCLSVTLHNALKHGERSGRVVIDVRWDSPSIQGVARFKAAVSSRFAKETDRREQLSRLKHSFASGDPEAAMVVEGYSGIRKLRYITRNPDGSSTANFFEGTDTLTVYFSLVVELATKHEEDQ